MFRGNGTMVLNADDTRVLGMSVPGRRVVHFGLGALLAAGDYGARAHDGGEWLVRGEERLLRVSEVLLAGRHNLANVLAAMALSDTVGVPVAAQIEAVRRFRGLPHRTELVAEQEDGVRWINDSKGTNVGATVAALNGMTAPTILIAGGDGKGQDFGELKFAVAVHARAVVLDRARCPADRSGARQRRTDAARRRSASSRGARAASGAAGRCRAAVAGLRQLRHVPQL